MRKSLTQEEFLIQATEKHKNKYNYEKSLFTKMINKLIITCPYHGDFKQGASRHLNGNGCPTCCVNNRRNSLENFISRSNKIHNNFYDYSKVEYLHSKSKVIIICPTHREFVQIPNSHLLGFGCAKCTNDSNKINQNDFEKRANQIHHFKYDYSKVEYKHCRLRVIIICPVHGEFEQTPSSHLMSKGCQKCSIDGKKLSQEEFINKANKIHNFRYNYTKSIYTGYNNVIVIICLTHGDFGQNVNNHLAGSGCPKCGNFISNKESKWLDSLSIPLEWRHKTLKINNIFFQPDALDEENKTIYEFYGDFWHGNPKIFNSFNINRCNKRTFGELYKETIDREKLIIQEGYKIISIWENEFKIKNLLKNTLMQNNKDIFPVKQLLGRDEIEVDLESTSNSIKNKTILVTGSAGSIGSEVCRKICSLNPKTIILFDRNENLQFYLEKELNNNFENIEVVPRIGSIKDRDRVKAIFTEFDINSVFHCAASKHVDLGEKNVSEYIKNNIGGTKIIADAAGEFNCETMVFVSTDKVCNPKSILGVTKRIGEYYLQLMSKKYSNTKFISVRFGNVIGSVASVLEVWDDAIQKKEPIKITHLDMTRYFLSISESVNLLLIAAFIANSGDIYVLDMGESVKIIDLAFNLIKLRGLTPYTDINIEVSGVKPGEKIIEELLFSYETTHPTAHPRIRNTLTKIPSEDLFNKINELLDLQKDTNPKELRKILSSLVPEATLANV